MIDLHSSGLFLGRVWRAGIGPSVVAVRHGRVLDITTQNAPTMRDVLEQCDIARFAPGIDGTDLGSAEEITAASQEPQAEVTR